MVFDSSQVKWMSVLMGFILYVLVLACVWTLRLPSKKRDDIADYHEWRGRQDDPNASYQEYFASDAGPRKPLSRWEKAIIVTALAALALYFALVRWKALYEY